MGEIYDFYEGIDKTLELYNFAIKYWYNAKLGVKTKMLYKLSFSLISLIRLEINSAAVVIARTNEIINDLESNTEKEEYEKQNIKVIKIK